MYSASLISFAAVAAFGLAAAHSPGEKTVAVIGAGFSGLTASLELRKLGYEVVVFDKLSSPGGRAQREAHTHGNASFAFDTGPSWYWMPEVFDEVLARFGQRRSDHYNITRLDPAYRLVFGAGGDREGKGAKTKPDPSSASASMSIDALDVPGTREGFLEMAQKLDPAADINAFFEDAAVKYDVGTRRAIWEVPAWPLPSWLLSPGLSPSLITTTLSEHIASYTSSQRLRDVLEWPSQFLGMNATDSPSLYSLLTYAGHALGTWMPLGPHGMQAPAIALYDTARAMGVQFHLGTEILALDAEGRRRITAVRTADGRSFSVDGVVAAADYHHVEQKLLPPSLRRHNGNYWEKQVMTPSTLIFKLCVAAAVPALPLTHALWFDDMALPFYATSDAHMKRLMDRSAVINSTSVFLLVPTVSSGAHQLSRQTILARILARLGINPDTVVCGAEGYGPAEYTRDYHAFRGNAFGHANLLSQSMWLKPTMDSLAENLVNAGHLTHPGPGVPPAMVSGILAANLLHEQLTPVDCTAPAVVLVALVLLTVATNSRWVKNARALHKGGRTYFAAASAMPLTAFSRIAALYAAFRKADDLVDCTHVDATTRLNDLNRFEQEVLKTKESRLGYPSELWQRFFAAMRSDCDPKGICCCTMEDLVAYMGGSAAVLGEFMLPVLVDGDPEVVLSSATASSSSAAPPPANSKVDGAIFSASSARSVSSVSSTSIDSPEPSESAAGSASSPSSFPSSSPSSGSRDLHKEGGESDGKPTISAALLAPARALGYAFQLTNMLRDVVEDGRLKRQYIPVDVCVKHGIPTPADLATAALDHSDPRFRAVMEDMFVMADEWYRQADEGIAGLPDATRLQIALARTSYHRLHDGIRAAGYKLEPRVVVPWRLKLADAVALLSWWGVARMVFAELVLSLAGLIGDWGVCVSALSATWLACQVVDVEGVITYGQFHAVWTVPLLAAMIACLWLLKASRPQQPAYSTQPPSDLVLALRWTAVLCVVAFVYTTPWDSFLIKSGVWASSAEQVSGTFLEIPFEEYAFFILATLITCFTWMLTWPQRWNDVDMQATPSRLVTAGLVALFVLGGICVFATNRTFYLGALLLWSVPVLMLQWLVGGHVIAAHRGPFVRVVLLAGFGMALLDQWAIKRNIWVLNPEFSLWAWARGLHPEEVLFFLLSSAMCAGGLTLAIWVSKGFRPYLLPPYLQGLLQAKGSSASAVPVKGGRDPLAPTPQGGLYLSSAQPELECTDLPLTGRLPSWLTGVLLRNGPGKYELTPGGPSLGHLFDGLALLQRYSIDGKAQRVTAQTRFLRSGAYCGFEALGRPVKRDFGTNPAIDLKSKLSLLLDPSKSITDNASANLVRVGGELLALTETSLGFVVDEKTLETLGGFTALREPKRFGEVIVSPTAHVMQHERLRATVNLQSHIAVLPSLGGYSITITPWDLNPPRKAPVSSSLPRAADSVPRSKESSTSPSFASTATAEAAFAWNAGLEKASRQLNVPIPPLCQGTGIGNKAGTKWWNTPLSHRKSALPPTYHHSFAMTDRFVVICEAPMRFSTLAAAGVMLAGADVVLDIYPWTGDTDSTRFLVVDIASGEIVAVAPVAGPGFLSFHLVNAFENTQATGSAVTVDLCAYDDPSFLREMLLERLRKGGSEVGGGYLRRFEIDLATGAVREPWSTPPSATGGSTVIAALTAESLVLHPVSASASPISHALELPRINEQAQGKPSRFIFAPRVDRGDGFTAMLKLDLGNEQAKPSVVAKWEGVGLLPGEPVFVPRPSNIDNSAIDSPVAEDDGVLLVMALDSASAEIPPGSSVAPPGLRSVLVVLDAVTMQELARAPLPMHLPLSYHGNFYFSSPSSSPPQS